MKWFRENWILICFLLSIITITSIIAAFIFAGIHFVDETILQNVYSEYFNLISIGVSVILMLFALCMFIKYARAISLVKSAERKAEEDSKSEVKESK